MNTVTWKIQLKSNPKRVFEFISTSKGRERFWAEKAAEKEGFIQFLFPNGQTYRSRVIRSLPYKEYHLDYFHSLVKFKLEQTEYNGTDLALTHENVPEDDFSEVNAGWVSVLMNLKAVADFECDLRNHDPEKTWNQGYADN